MKTIVSIVGPTAIGKTALAIEVGKHFNTEIISADSRQFYREMCIGTAKPNDEELHTVPHHFINSHSIHDPFSAGDFEQAGLQEINTLFNSHDTVVMVGGSGLFVNALLDGLDDLPKAKDGIREGLNQAYQEKGLLFIQQRLQALDPAYYEEVDVSNPQRMIRALEVIESTGVPFSHWRKNKKTARNFNVISIGLQMERSRLYERINLRVDQMMQAGLLKEVESLQAFKSLPALQTVGYAELFNYLEEQCSLEDAIAKIKQNTRKYAKRQITWFKRNQNTKWFDVQDRALIMEYLTNKLSS